MERDTARVEVDARTTERDAARTKVPGGASRRDEPSAELEARTTERDVARAEAFVRVTERDEACDAVVTCTVERERARAEAVTRTNERDGLVLNSMLVRLNLELLVRLMRPRWVSYGFWWRVRWRQRVRRARSSDRVSVITLNIVFKFMLG